MREDEEEQVRKMVSKVEAHRYREKIIEYICSLRKEATAHKSIQTEEPKEKRSSGGLKTLGQRATVFQVPRFSRVGYVPRVHPCNKFIISLAEKISK